MKRFTSAGQAQRFLSAHAGISNLFHLRRQVPATQYRAARTQALQAWAEVTYDPAADVFTCPEGRTLRHRGYEPRTATHRYYARPSDCRVCPRKPGCTKASARRVLRMVDEDARDRVRGLQDTPEFARPRRLRRWIERLFGHLKRSLGLQRLKLRGLRGAATCGMAAFYAEAIACIPLGMATAVQFAGPLAVAIAASRGLLDIACAFASAACWAAYIVLTKRVGQALQGLQGLTVPCCHMGLTHLPENQDQIIRFRCSASASINTRTLADRLR